MFPGSVSGAYLMKFEEEEFICFDDETERIREEEQLECKLT